jgi:hypothetical protein
MSSFLKKLWPSNWRYKPESRIKVGDIFQSSTTTGTRLKKSKKNSLGGTFEETKNLKDLSQLLQDWKMMEFYKIANKLIRIKSNHPVVSRVKQEIKGQDRKYSRTERWSIRR